MSDKKKLSSSFKNMLISLTAISLVSAFAVGLAYTGTKEAAAKVQQEKLENAIKEVVPAFDRLAEPETVKVGTDELTVYKTYKGEAVSGTAIETVSHKGFGGDLEIMVGFDAEGNIHNSAILSIKETPGLGSKLPTKKDQINGKKPGEYKLKVKKDGGDFDAITAATISSRAFMDAVSKAVEAYSGSVKEEAKK